MAAITERLPAGVKHIPEESTSVKDAVNKTLAETIDLARRTKLTWDPKKLPVRGEAKMIGSELCTSLPYMLVDKRYYIQNMRVYRLNGVQTTLEDVFAEENPVLAAHVKEAYDAMADQAAQSDPNLCRYCWVFTATSLAAYLKHMVDEHPDVVTDVAKGRVETPYVKPTCRKCGREFNSEPAMNFHMWKKHNQPMKESAEPEETQEEAEADPDQEI
jgi:hypothetical protein